MLKEEKKQIILDKLSNYGFTDDFTIKYSMLFTESSVSDFCRNIAIFNK
jgi:hypothetical protein